MAGNMRARARAHPNIAFIKYWGNRDAGLRLPANGSLSMNLGALHTTTTLTWADGAEADGLRINGEAADSTALGRVSGQLDVLRERLGASAFALVDSCNNFPMGAGIASSASAFAALTVAGAGALGMELGERELSVLARRGSGSAARSVPAGYVEWHAGDSHEGAYAESIAGPEHWDLVDVIAAVSRGHKAVGSTEGHALAGSSVLQAGRVRSAPERLALAKQAILQRDFGLLAQVVEEDSNMMHAVMMTSRPALFYWEPLSLQIMLAVRSWREREGIQVCYTVDAGPNVHCICRAGEAEAVVAKLRGLSPGMGLIRSAVGGGAVLLGPRNEA